MKKSLILFLIILVSLITPGAGNAQSAKTRRIVHLVIGEQNSEYISDILQNMILAKIGHTLQSELDYSCQFFSLTPTHTQCIAWSKSAMEPGDRMAGVIVWNGEQAARKCAGARDWAARFAGVVQILRDEYGNPSLPVYFAQLGKKPATGYPCWNLVRKQQASIDIPNVKMVVTTGISRLPGSVLYDPQGYDLLARRYWRFMNRHIDP